MSLPEEGPVPEEQPGQEQQPSEVPESGGETSPEPEPVPETQPDFSAEEPVLPPGFTPLDAHGRLPRSRRRRANRMLVPPGPDERAAVLGSLARRAVPSFEFFLFAFLCGAILGAAYLMDSPALLLLGILLAPLLTPWVGLVLAVQTGSWRFFFLTLMGVLVASLLVFLTGALAGIAGHLWLPLPLTNASVHSHLWWPDLLLVALGAILLTVSFVNSEQKPVLPSVMLAYGLFLPLSAGGIGLGMGVAPIFPDGAKVFAVHLALALFVGVITLAALRFKPSKFGGFILLIMVSLVSLAAVVYYTGLTDFIRSAILNSRTTVPTPTLTVPTPLPTSTRTHTATPTITATATPTFTSTASATPQPTPSYSVIASPSGGGALVRSEPGGGTVLTVLTNGIIVQSLPEIQFASGFNWVRVRWGNLDGWIESDVLVATTATPPPPTATPTATP